MSKRRRTDVNANEVEVAPAARFYRGALTQAEQSDMPAALEVTGIDQEIAMLRLRLRSALKDNPEDLRLMFKGLAVLVRLVATRYQLSKDDTHHLEEAALASFRV